METPDTPIMSATQESIQDCECKDVEMKKSESGAGQEQKVALPPSITDSIVSSTDLEQVDSPPSIPESSSPRQGRWSPEEKLLFLHGLKLYGRGNWKKIRAFLPLRSLVQIKSHGQKVLKRVDAGEDIWAPLRDKPALVQRLVAKQTSAPDFILPRIPARASIARLPKTKLKPRPAMTFDRRPMFDATIAFSYDKGRRDIEASPKVFKTMIGPGASNLSFSFRGAPLQQGQHKEPAHLSPHSFASPSECQTPQRPEPTMMKPSAVMAAAALCQLSAGASNDKKKTSSDSNDDQNHRVNLVSP